jgi:hypothetical protein
MTPAAICGRRLPGFRSLRSESATDRYYRADLRKLKACGDLLLPSSRLESNRQAHDFGRALSHEGKLIHEGPSRMVFTFLLLSCI